MRSLVLALALAALLAPATPASIPHSEPFEKKLTDAVKEVFETDAKIQKADDVEQPITVKDVDNQLLKKASEDIPVKVIVEDVQPALKVSEEQKDDEKNEVIYNEVDLKHPGEPQRQEHETQNPEHHEDQDSSLTALKQMIADSQVVFNNGFKEVSEHIAEWLRDNKSEITIKDSIANLQEQFMENIDKLNATIQSYWNQGADAEKQGDIKKVQTGLKVLEEKFESGVQNLNNGVRTLAELKTGRDDATTTAKPSSNPFGFVTGMWQTVTHQFGNISNQIQNIIGQNNNTTQATAGAQSDDPSGTTAKPGVWQNIQNQFQGLFQNRPGQQGAQNDEQPSQSGPFAQVIQNVPLLQNFVNFIQPKPQSAEPSKPADPAQPSEGSNVVPAESQASSDPTRPADQQQKKPDEQAQPAQPQRPIQQIIQKNPIVQSITGAVQKIQHSITNPEKPREEVEKEAAEKGGFFPYYGHGHRPGDGDNNVSGVGLEKSVPAEAETSPLVEAQSAVEAEKETPVDAEKIAPVEAVKSAPVNTQSASVVIEKISPVEAVKSVVVDAEKSSIVEPVKSAPVEAQSTPVEVEKPAPAPVSQEVVKQD